MKILIVDDEKEIRELLVACMSNEGYEAVEAVHGKQALELFDDSFDLILLDVMMPFMDGITTCLEIRKTSKVPIVFLTAKSQDTDQILGLTAGADDYIKKPFMPSVLVAKVKAILRRSVEFNENSEKKLDNIIAIDNLKLDIEAHQLFMNGLELKLTKTEFEILTLLATNRGQVFSIERIYESIWKEEYYEVSANTVMVHIKKLRDKVDKGRGKDTLIKTVWGVGYKIEKV